MLRAIWQHRGFIGSLVLRGFRDRSARTLWGHAWLAIQPAIQITIYVVIFSEVLRARLPGDSDRVSYSLFVCAGLITWSFFADLLMGGRTLFLENADLLRTIRFPRSLLPASLLARASVDFVIPLVIFLVVVAAVGRWPGVVILGALPFLVIQTVFGISLAVLCGTLNVFVRDVGHVVTVTLQFWFWLTPIVYPLSIIPEPVLPWLAWNPMLHIVSAYQSVVVFGVAPDWDSLLPLTLLVVGLALAAWAVFRVLSPDLVDEL